MYFLTMKSLIDFLMKVNIWIIFFISVTGAVIFSILLGYIINLFLYDGTNNLLMLGAVLIPAIDAPIFIALLIFAIIELKKSRLELDQRVAERTRELKEANLRLSREIRERKEVEKKLLHAHKMEAIGTLAGGIAHDFNNILSAVIGFTELSLDGVEKGSTIEANLQEVYKAGNRAKELVRQILAFSRQEESENQPVQVSGIVKEVLKLLRSSIPAGIEIQSDIKSKAYIMGDPISVHQILMNLTTNASHAMEKGGILNVSLRDVKIGTNENPSQKGLPPGNYVEMKISDTGTGIPGDHLDMIFEPYFTTKPTGEGSGMGLSVVHGIVNRYGGDVFVESTPGQGAVFSVLLPYQVVRNKYFLLMMKYPSPGWPAVSWIPTDIG